MPMAMAMSDYKLMTSIYGHSHTVFDLISEQSAQQICWPNIFFFFGRFFFK